MRLAAEALPQEGADRLDLFQADLVLHGVGEPGDIVALGEQAVARSFAPAVFSFFNSRVLRPLTRDWLVYSRRTEAPSGS